MIPIAIIAEFHFKSNALNAGLAIIRAIIKPSQEEKGCLFYECYQDDKDEHIYVMIEHWESHHAWQEHLQSDHIVQAAASIEAFLIAPIKVRSFSLMDSIE